MQIRVGKYSQFRECSFKMCNLLPLNDIITMRYNCVWFVDDKLRGSAPMGKCAQNSVVQMKLLWYAEYTELFSYWHRVRQAKRLNLERNASCRAKNSGPTFCLSMQSEIFLTIPLSAHTFSLSCSAL